jgi:hypothetical protein
MSSLYRAAGLVVLVGSSEKTTQKHPSSGRCRVVLDQLRLVAPATALAQVVQRDGRLRCPPRPPHSRRVPGCPCVPPYPSGRRTVNLERLFFARPVIHRYPGRWPSESTSRPSTCATATTAMPRVCGPPRRSRRPPHKPRRPPGLRRNERQVAWGSALQALRRSRPRARALASDARLRRLTAGAR